MVATEYVVSKYPTSSGAVIQMLSRMQHGQAGDVPWLDKLALYIVGGYQMVCHDLPAEMAEGDPDSDLQRSAVRAELINVDECMG